MTEEEKTNTISLEEVKHDTSPEDYALVERAQKGDSVAMEALINKYMWLARSIARKYFLNNGGYDDLLQEGLMGLFHAVRHFDASKNDNLVGFMSMCVSSSIKDAVRSSSRIKNRILSEATTLENFDRAIPTEFVYDPVHNYIEREGVDNFYQKLNELFKPFQLTVLKYYLEGYTYVEIAEILHQPVKKIDNTLHQIKTKIKKNRDLF
ncbi:MAG: sigma-70 family RNA polymerase sigma factor [Clostridia bacterium]|nr:sigma-70 family RNA polymerase sigma factor [Clostridia bacterium]